MPDDAGLKLAPPPSLDKLRARAKSLTKRQWAAIAVGAALVLLAYPVFHWATVGRFEVSTENAYVRADISLISAQIEGYVKTLPVRENENVHVGDVLVEIDPTEFQAHVAAAQAALAQAEGGRAQTIAQQQWAQSQVQRYEPLARSGMLSPAGMEQYRIQARQAGGGLAAADASVQAARAQLEATQLDLTRTVIHAPIDGVVGDRQVQVGQLVRVGAPLMAVVPLQSVYVVANFKETQLAHLHPGQTVTIVPDIQHGLHLRGRIDSLSPASGAEFSIIPTDTATGNFTKIVQRVPVRIRIEPGQSGAELLRPGLSVTATVDTRE